MGENTDRLFDATRKSRAHTQVRTHRTITLLHHFITSQHRDDPCAAIRGNREKGNITFRERGFVSCWYYVEKFLFTYWLQLGKQGKQVACS